MTKRSRAKKVSWTFAIALGVLPLAAWGRPSVDVNCIVELAKSCYATYGWSFDTLRCIYQGKSSCIG